MVVSANFLLDSESSLRAALAGGWGAGRPATSTTTPRPRPGAGPPQPTPASPAAATYACPMHPEQRSDRPGKCALCGMDLEAVPAPHRH